MPCSFPCSLSGSIHLLNPPCDFASASWAIRWTLPLLCTAGTWDCTLIGPALVPSSYLPVRALEAVKAWASKPAAGSDRWLTTFGLVLLCCAPPITRPLWPCFTGSMPEIAAGLGPCYERRPRNAGLTKTAHCRVARKVTPNQWTLTTRRHSSARGKKSNTTPREFDHKTAPSACGKQKSDTEPKQLDHKTALSWRGKKSGAKQGNLKMSSLPWCVPQHAAEAQRSRAGVAQILLSLSPLQKKTAAKAQSSQGIAGVESDVVLLSGSSGPSNAIPLWQT